MRIIMASMLGVYSHVQISALFNRRLQLYHWYIYGNVTIEDICLWINNYKTIVQYIIREFIFVMIENIPALNSYLEDTYHW